MMPLSVLYRAAAYGALLLLLQAGLFSTAWATGTVTEVAATAHFPPAWLVLPFALLLLMIATGPLFYARFWEHHYPKVSIVSGFAVLLFYAFAIEGGWHILLHTLEEYLSFMALITALFVVSGGILIRIERDGSPLLNAIMLLFGAFLANIVGTTGASMLLIRPYLRMNEGRLRGFHIVFFIFIVSNIGGALTPIGDPPLFLGFLRGVPFFWVLQHLWLPWLLTIIALCLILMALDSRVGKSFRQNPVSGSIRIRGSRNFLYLGLLILSVFLDPSLIRGLPSLQAQFHLPFGIRELVMAIIAVVAYKTADREALKGNEFNFEPIREVAFLFIGIFVTMIPALQLIGRYGRIHSSDLTVSSIYWFTGLLSGVLDNAPTYLNFLSAALGKFGLDAGSATDVRRFAEGVASPVPGDASSQLYLMAISLASVFFGAMTYIGNAPNFMVRNIASQTEAEVPGFVEYVVRYSVPVLVPVFAVLWFTLFNR